MTRDTVWFGHGADRVAGMASHLEEKFTCDELIDYLLTKLALYEDSGLTPEEVASMANLKSAGKLKLMPCAIGDTVYEIRIKYTKKLKGKGKAYDYSCIGHPGSLKYDPASCYVAPKICTKTDLLHIGKMVYTTEQEANEVLKEAKRNARCSATE